MKPKTSKESELTVLLAGQIIVPDYGSFPKIVNQILKWHEKHSKKERNKGFKEGIKRGKAIQLLNEIVEEIKKEEKK